MHGFGNGMFLSIGAKREHFPDGSEFEGVGVVPDVGVHPTTQDFRSGDDPVLKRAIEIASQP
jgi:carboxyl-terminal processing protease